MHVEIIHIYAIVVNQESFNEESDSCSNDSGSDSSMEAPRGCNLMKASTEILYVTIIDKRYRLSQY